MDVAELSNTVTPHSLYDYVSNLKRDRVCHHSTTLHLRARFCVEYLMLTNTAETELLAQKVPRQFGLSDIFLIMSSVSVIFRRFFTVLTVGSSRKKKSH